MVMWFTKSLWRSCEESTKLALRNCKRARFIGTLVLRNILGSIVVLCALDVDRNLILRSVGVVGSVPMKSKWSSSK